MHTINPKIADRIERLLDKASFKFAREAWKAVHRYRQAPTDENETAALAAINMLPAGFLAELRAAAGV